MRLGFLLSLLLLGAGCAQNEGGSVDGDQSIIDVSVTQLDARVVEMGPDAEFADMALPDMGPLRAEDYCERTVGLFCDYYIRCGRMAVEDVATCRGVFLEACNQVYEPVYVAYAEAGMLSVSAAGIAACAAHLRTVECAAQIYDLDGPCGQIWVGQQPAESVCSPGIGSFVCDETSTCVIGLDFCGTCRAVAEIGAACDEETRCHSEAACVEGFCVRRGLAGEACANRPCVVAAACVDDRCVAPAIVTVGAACDRARRCPYKSACRGGQCVETALLDEPCGDEVGCASGVCNGNVCVALATEGAACARGAACVGGICAEGQCAPAISGCF